MNEETKKKKNNWGGNKVACPFGFMSKVWKQCHGKSVKNIRNMFIFTGLDLRKLKIQINNENHKKIYFQSLHSNIISLNIAHHSTEVIDPKVLCVTERY